MKTKYTSLLVAIIICVGLLSCDKEVNNPINNSRSGSVSPVPIIMSSDWFSAYWRYGVIMEFQKGVPELSTDIFKGGKVFVFGRGGIEMKDPTALPSSFDANFIGAKPEVGYIKFILEGSGAISSSLQFRYILIPSDKLVPGLDYKNYYAVCTYYQVAK